MRELLALLVPACAMGLLVPSLASCLGGRSRTAAAALALCLGIGVSSLTTTGFLAAGIVPGSRGFILADLTLWALVGAAGWWVRRGTWHAIPAIGSRAPAEGTAQVEWAVRAAFAATAALALATVTAIYRAAPHGEWDAWAIWNLRARFLFQGGDTWQNGFEIAWSQPDYPLLVPASVARVWAYAGHETTIGPLVIAMALASAAVMVVMAALDLRRRRAWVAGALLLGAGAFVAQVPSLCADVPLASFVVATLAVVCGHGTLLTERERPQAAALVAGAMSAMAGWTKNEGLVFALLVLVLVMIVALRRGAGRQILWWVAGGAPVVIAIAWFKLTHAPTTSLFESQGVGLYADRLFDLDRHLLVAALMGQHVLRWGGPLAVAMMPVVGGAAVWLAFGRDGGARRVAVGVIGLMLAAYYAVYLTTPFDITWHVSTSFDRLLAQVWPALVLAAFLPRPGEI